MQMTDQQKTAIARGIFEAYVTGDRAHIDNALTEDFTFTSPLDNRIDRETYFRRCWPNHERISGFAFIRVVPAGDEVFVTYEGEAEAGRRFRNTEVLTLRDGKVSQAEVYFGWNIPHDAPEGGHLDTATSS